MYNSFCQQRCHVSGDTPWEMGGVCVCMGVGVASGK